jgi:hypothetical protein
MKTPEIFLTVCYRFVIWEAVREDQLHPASSTIRPTCMCAVEGCISRIRMESQPQVGLGKPVVPLALNQVDMRLQHDDDGGRDTEKKWYRGMANMTGAGLENSNRTILDLDVEQNCLPRAAAQQRSTAERIHECCVVQGLRLHSHFDVWERRMGGCEHDEGWVLAGFHSYRTKTGVGQWGFFGTLKFAPGNQTGSGRCLGRGTCQDVMKLQRGT